VSQSENEEDSPVICQHRRRVVHLASVVTALSFGMACAHATSGQTSVDHSLRGSGAIERQIQGGTGARALRLDHLIPARDSQGSQPTHFEWTAVPGADSYSLGIWDEIDMMIWRKDGVPTNWFAPTDLHLDPGTYFWTISAVQGGNEIAASGLSAFVVRPTNP
jgi:hypothetical protein